MTFVYMLSIYEEDGAEEPTATLDRTKLVGMLTGNWPDAGKEEYAAALTELLKKPDEELCRRYGINLGRGWGGLQLHVIKLIE